MAYTKTNWTEATAITAARLNNQENGIEAVETYIDAQVAAANTNISNAKTPIANAITAKGVTTATTSTFSQMTTNIGQINAVKSIQQGVFNCNSGETVTTKTITLGTAINTNKSIIMVFKIAGFNAFQERQNFRFSFNSSTEILAERYSGESGDVTSYVYIVIEFHDWVKVQTGTKIGASSNAVISAVDPTKSMAFCSGMYSGNLYPVSIASKIASGTEISFYGQDLSKWTVRWFVVDFSTT